MSTQNLEMKEELMMRAMIRLDISAGTILEIATMLQTGESIMKMTEFLYNNRTADEQTVLNKAKEIKEKYEDLGGQYGKQEW